MRTRRSVLVSVGGVSLLAGCTGSEIVGDLPNSTDNDGSTGSGDSAGDTESQDQQPDEETTAEISGYIEIGEVVGVDTDGNQKIDTLRLELTRTTESEPVDLNAASYSILTQSGEIRINGDESTTGVSYVQPQGVEDGETTLSDQTGSITVEIDVTKINEIDQFTAGKNIVLRVYDPNDIASLKEVTTPQTIRTGESYVLSDGPQNTQTSESSSDDFVEKVQIDSVVGSDTDDDSRIDLLEISLRLSSGIKSFDLNDASYIIQVENSIKINGAASTSGVRYNQTQGMDNGETTLKDQTDIVTVEIDFTEINDMSPVGAEKNIEIIIEDEDGRAASTSVSTPRQINAGESYIL